MVLPSGGHLAALAIVLPACIHAFLGLDRRRFEDSRQAHLFWGTCAVVASAWALSVGVLPNLRLHLVATGAATLMFGPRSAIAIATVAGAVLALLGGVDWMALPVNLLVAGVLPAWTVHAWLRLVERLLPAHFFVYVFVAAFLGTGVSVLASGLASGLLVIAIGARSLAEVFENYWIWFLHLAYAEATITGMLITLMVVYIPAWVSSFDDARYLRGK